MENGAITRGKRRDCSQSKRNVTKRNVRFTKTPLEPNPKHVCHICSYHSQLLIYFYKKLIEMIKALQEQLLIEKRRYNTLELEIRAEVCSEMATQLVEIENGYR